MALLVYFSLVSSTFLRFGAPKIPADSHSRTLSDIPPSDPHPGGLGRASFVGVRSLSGHKRGLGECPLLGGKADIALHVPATITDTSRTRAKPCHLRHQQRASTVSS